MSIRITARPDRGIRRVGVHHPAAAVVYPDEFFAPDEIEILRNDPDLIVEMLDDEFATSAERAHMKLLDDRQSASSSAHSDEIFATSRIGSRPCSASPAEEVIEEVESRAPQAGSPDSGAAQSDVGHAPASIHMGASAEQSAAEGEGADVVPDDPEATRDMILLLGDYDQQDAELLLEIVQHWTPAERLSVEQYCSAVHLAASDNEGVTIPPHPDVLASALADIADARNVREAEAKRAAKRRNR